VRTKEDALATSPATESDSGPAAPRGALRVLVVDDERLIGRFVTNALTGDVVEAFEKPHQALARLEHATFDFVLCDLMMPEMTGLEFYEQLARSHPRLASRFGLMTGAMVEGELETFLRVRRIRLLKKPFGVSELRSCVRTESVPTDLEEAFE
jgi:CheY-like chemotaxis protein